MAAFLRLRLASALRDDLDLLHDGVVDTIGYALLKAEAVAADFELDEELAHRARRYLLVLFAEHPELSHSFERITGEPLDLPAALERLEHDRLPESGVRKR